MANLSTPIVYFKKEAKKLFRQVQSNDAEAIARAQRVLKDLSDISLMRIQHVVAIEYGFSKWEDLIKASPVDLHSAISKKQASDPGSITRPLSNATPLGNFFRGPGIIPTSPHFGALADMFDKMTLDEQRRYLDEDARAMRQINRR